MATRSRRRSSASGVESIAGVELVAARFLIEKAFESAQSASRTRGIRLGIGGFITRHEPGIVRLAKQAGQGQRDWPNSSS